MVTPIEQIAQQREAIRKAQERARQIEARKPTRRELLKMTLAQKIRRQLEERRIKKISQRELSKISKYEKEFETKATKYEKELGIYGKSLAERQLETQAYKQATGMYKKGISSAWLSLGKPTSYQIKVRKYLREFEKEGRIYGKPSSTPTWETQAKGTYDPKTGIYISPEGLGYSMAEQYVPTRTRVIGKKTFGLLQKPTFDVPSSIKLKGEIYDPKSQVYRASLYGIGAGGTQLERIPTYEERIKIKEAQEKPEKWKKYIEDPTGKRALETPKDVFGEQYTYKELYKAGALPTIVRKAAAKTGLFFVEAGERITGGEVPPKMKKQTAQAIGTLFLFAGFSPAMRTGTYSEEISKQLSKTKFDKLKELLGKAEKQIAEQKTLKEQAKILKQIKDGLKTPEQIKNYNLWVKSLKEKGIIHSVKVDVAQLGEYKPAVTGEIAIEIPKDIPVEKIGVMAIDPSKVRDVSWMGEKAKVDQIQEPLSMNIFQEVSKAKPLISTAALRLKELQKEKLVTKPKQIFIQPLKEISKVKQTQLQRQAQRQRQAQLQRQIQRERLAQIQKQVQISKLRAKLKPKLKIPVPFKFGEAIKKVTKMVKERPKEFKVFVTKFGKEVEIGIRKTKKEAEKLLRKELFGTLRAGGGIKVEGKKLKAEEIKLDFGFRKSKVDPFKIEKKKERRLKRGTQEVPELLFFKSRSKGLKKKKDIFGL